MNDLERDLRDLLHEDALGVSPPTRPPEGLSRITRRRQARFAALVGVSAVTLLTVIVAAALALTPSGDVQRRPAGDETAGVRTSTVRGVTITYPAHWTLNELADDVNVGEGRVGPEGTILGEAILELTPSDAGPAVRYCPGGDPLPLEGSPILYVQQLDSARIPGSTPPPWPVDLGGPVTDPQPTTCESAFEHYVTWTAEGRIYEAFLTGSGTDYGRLVEAFGSLRFDGDLPPMDPILTSDGEIAAGPYRVLDSGVTEGQRWNLIVYATSFPYVTARLCIGLEVEGTHVGSLCDLDMAAGEASGGAALGFEGTSARVRSGGTTVTYAWGAVHQDVERIEFQGEQPQAIESFRSDIPTGFDVAFEALVVVGDADAEGAITTFIGSNMTGALPFGLDGAAPLDV